MLGNDSIPYWFRRAVSFLTPESPGQALRPTGGISRRQAMVEERQIARRLAARDSTLRGRRGPKALEEIVLSWEEQTARKALAAETARKRRGLRSGF